MAKMDNITAEYLRAILDYNPGTGVLTWRRRPVEHFKGGRCVSAAGVASGWNAKYSGKPAGATNAHGHVVISINKIRYNAHRIAWFIYYGHQPNGEIDHANCNPSDNRIVNLREATRAENVRNRGRSRPNTRSIYKGVSWSKACGKWVAEITVSGQRTRLGYFEVEADAASAYDCAAERLHGAFARTNTSMNHPPTCGR